MEFKLRSAIAIGLVGLLVVAWLVWRSDEPLTAPEPDASVDPTAPADDPPENPAQGPDSLAAAPPPDAEPRSFRVHTNVPGAMVVLRLRYYGGSPDPEPMETVADADGLAGFTAPDHEEPLAFAEAEATAAGHMSAEGTLYEGEIRLELRPGWTVRGRVQSESGGPIEGAWVEIDGGEGGESGPGGEFEVFAPSVDPCTVRAEHPDHVHAESSVTPPSDGVLLSLPAGCEVRGRVTFPDGKPFPDAQVNLAGVRRYTFTDAQGLYVLSGLPAGEVEVNCGLAPAPRTVTAPAVGVDFVAEKHLVCATLTDEEGRPFRQAFVHVRGTSAGEFRLSSVGRIGEGGRWRQTAPPGVKLVLTADVDGYRTASAELDLSGPPRRHEVRMVLRRTVATGSIRLLAVDEEGRPLPRAVVSLLGPSGAMVSGFSEVAVALDENGHGRLENVPTGPHVLRVSDGPRFFSREGYGLACEVEVAVVAGSEASTKAVVRLGGRLTLRVLGPDGELMVPPRIRLTDSEGKHANSLFFSTDEAGTSSMPPDDAGPAHLDRPLPPGRYTMVLDRGEDEPIRREVHLHRGETTKEEIRLDR